MTKYIKSYADVICLRNTGVYFLTDRLNQLISEMEHRGRKRNRTVIWLQLVVGLFYWPDSLKDSPIQLNNLQTHCMHLPSWCQQRPFHVFFFFNSMCHEFSTILEHRHYFTPVVCFQDLAQQWTGHRFFLQNTEGSCEKLECIRCLSSSKIICLQESMG